MTDFLVMFLGGFLWVLVISINTRIVAHRTDFALPAGWGFIVGLVWISIVRRVVLSDEWYALVGYALGGAIATGIVTKFMKRPSKKEKNHEQGK